MHKQDIMPQYSGKRYFEYRRYDFRLGKNDVILVEPKEPAPGRRWVWCAEFFNAFPSFDLEMLANGWFLAFMNVGNTFGSPPAMRRFDVFYREMTEKYSFHRKPVLEGLSRGGLYVYNWAAENPDKVGLIYADNAVCDIKSWPGGKGRALGSPEDWKLLQKYYGFKSESEAMAWKKNPVDRAEIFVRAGIPMFHSYGNADVNVPWEENTGLMAERVAEAGGEIRLFVKEGFAHHPHGPGNPALFAELVIANSLPEK